jgi:hypothetical protein
MILSSRTNINVKMAQKQLFGILLRKYALIAMHQIVTLSVVNVYQVYMLSLNTVECKMTFLLILSYIFFINGCILFLT